MESKTILVTGGCGFIGSNVVDLLVESGYNVVVIDNMSTGKEKNKNPKASYYIEDIRSIEALKTMFYDYDIDAVLHFAAIARVQNSIDKPIETHSVNVGGTLNLLHVCRRFDVKKFVFASSSSVYGKQDTHIMNEDMIHRPLSPYALQKSQAEQYGRMWSRLYDIDFTALRFFNVYGNRQNSDGAYALVIAKFLRQVKSGEKMTIYGDGKQTRDYTNVVDVANACKVALESDISGFRAFNVGTGVETSVNTISRLIGGESKHIIPNPRGHLEEDRKCSDIAKIHDELKWRPEIDIKTGIYNLI